MDNLKNWHVQLETIFVNRLFFWQLFEFQNPFSHAPSWQMDIVEQICIILSSFWILKIFSTHLTQTTLSHQHRHTASSSTRTIFSTLHPPWPNSNHHQTTLLHHHCRATLTGISMWQIKFEIFVLCCFFLLIRYGIFIWYMFQICVDVF